MADLHLVPAHGWVVAAVGASYIVHNLFMSIKVGAARKKYGEWLRQLMVQKSLDQQMSSEQQDL